MQISETGQYEFLCRKTGFEETSVYAMIADDQISVLTVKLRQLV